MNKLRNKRKLNKYIIRIFVLLIFITSFYLLNYLYTLGNRDSKTIVLDKKSFPGAIDDGKAEKLQVSNVLSYDADYLMMEPKISNSNAIVFKTINTNNTTEICSLDVENKITNTIYAKSSVNLNNLNIANDTKKIIYTQASDGNGENKTYLIDADTISSKEIYNDVLSSVLVIDGNRIVGIVNNSVIIKELDTGKIEKIMSIDEDATNTQYKNLKKAYSLTVSRNGKVIYVIDQGLRNENDAYLNIKAINIDSKEVTNLKIKGSVLNLIPLKDGNFIFNGNIEGNNGIYIYNMANNTYKVLKSGDINEVSLTEDENKIAYVSSDTSSNNNEVHVALFDKDKIESDTMIYRNTQYGNNIIWTNEGDNLFIINSNNGKTRIYRFSISR
jgi:hypothetical protein